MMKNKISFEEFLEEKYFELYPELLDNQISDELNVWIMDLDTQDVIEYAQEYADFLTELQKNRIKNRIEDYFNNK